MEPSPISLEPYRPASVDEGRRLQAAGDFAGAEAVYGALLATRSDDPVLLHLMGVLRHQQGRAEEAVRLIEAALDAAPTMAAAWQNLVLPLVALKRWDAAMAASAEAVRLSPDGAGAWINRAVAALNAGRLDEAAEAAETALALDPAAIAWQTIGNVRGKQKRWALAERHYRRALALRPGSWDARAGIAEALYEQGRNAEALPLWRALLAERPDDAVARVNLGATLRSLGDLRAALAVWSDGPRRAELVYNAGCARLALGDWPAGWEGYESRFDIPPERPPAKVDGLPLWRGEPVGTLLVHHEQGLGDTIQFAPLLARLLDRAERIVLVCQRPLHGLLSAMPAIRAAAGRIAVVRDGDAVPRPDAWMPLLSAPHRLQLGLATPSREPTIVPDPERVSRWRDRLDAAAGAPGALRVGLVWQGNPNAPAERGRSIPLAAFAPLSTVGGVALVALQKGFGREQMGRAPTGLRLVDPGADFDAGPDAFLDTAALAASLDLVVTTDTSVAHVVAGTGRPVWLLLRHVPDWRWGLSGDFVPWYPSVRLFRQPGPGDWEPVIASVAAALAEAAEAKASGDPGFAAGFQRAVSDHAAGRIGAAAAGYRRRLLLAPDDARAANLLAVALKDGASGDRARLDEAAGLARRSAALAPDDPDLNANAAVVLRATGATGEAEALLRGALAARPGHPAAVNNLVNLLTARGAADEAVRAASAAASARPRDPAVLKSLAAALRAAKRHAEAAGALRLVLSLAPEDDDARIALGGVLTEAGDNPAARGVFEELLERDPGNAEAWSNLGVVEKRIDGPELSVWLYGRALARAPDHVDARANLGSALVEMGRWDAAADTFRAALVRRPDHPEAHMALGMALLADGRYREGWAEYEGRVGSLRLGLASSAPPVPRWRGEDVRGKALLVLCEQGFGDAIQFVRYAAVVKAMGAARVVVGCRRRLAALLASAPGVDAVVPEGGRLPAVDLHAHIMSLPHLAGTALETVPAAIPYLAPDPERVTAWARRLSEKPGFRVGLVWQGNPDPGVDRGRSVPLAALEPLARIPGVRLIALQKGPGAEQVEAIAGRFAVETLGDDFDGGDDAFADTAAVMENLDLVVSTDTAALHLAGSLGRPTFALLKRHAEWRWLKDREDSPWYPTLRLFRQTDAEASSPAPFAGAVDRLAAALAALAGGDRSALLPKPVTPAPPEPVAAAAARFDSALAAHRAGRVAEAEAAYAALLADHPDHLEAVHMLGAAALQRFAFRRALILLREARAMGLDSRELRANLAVALRRTGRTDEAEALLRGILSEAPDLAEARATLGGILVDGDRLEEGIAELRTAIRLAPAIAAPRRTLGNAFRDLGRIDEAAAAIDEAVTLDPADPEGYIDRAHVRLMRGDYVGGFADYEWRWKGMELQPRPFDVPRWDGAPFPGTLLVHGEQGLGDNIQFARFVAAACARAGEVILEVRRPLVALLSTLDPAVRVVEQGSALPPHDREIPLMSLPHALGLDLEGVGMAAPYLRADADRVARWSERLGSFDGPTVGLIWQGNPKARADKGRSPPLAALAPLFDIPGLRFVALQKEHGLDQLSGFADRIVHPGPDFDIGPDAFLDTAAALSLCDAVVTSDTAVAHLAGALMRRTFTLLKAVPDWRWMLGRTDSPWYPSMRLVRQPARGDWTAAGRAVAETLRTEVAGR